MDGELKGMGRLAELGLLAAVLADGALSELTCQGGGQASHKADKEQ